MPLNQAQENLGVETKIGFSDLRAVLVNTSLKKRATDSHTRLLLSVVGEIMQKQAVALEHVHMLDYEVAPGVSRR